MVQKPDRRDFSGITENTFAPVASSKMDSTVDQHINNETRNIENFEGCDFLALRPNYNR